MLIEEAIRAHLIADAGVAAIAAGRIYPEALPQEPVYPAIVYHRVGTGRSIHMGGADGLADARFQFDCWGRTFAESRQLSEQVRLAFVGFRGSMGGVGGVEVCGVFPEGEISDYDDDFRVYIHAPDFTFTHVETRPAA